MARKVYGKELCKKNELVTQIRFTDKQIKNLLPTEKVSRKPATGARGKRFIVASVGPFSFDVTPKLSTGKMDVSVLFFGVPVGDVLLGKDSVEASLGPNLGFAKADITVTVDWERHVIIFSAKACVRNWRFKWTCSRYQGTIYRW